MRDFDGQVQSMNQWINDSEKLVNSLCVGMDPDEVSKRIQEIKVDLESNFKLSVESYLVFHSSFLFSCRKVSLFYVKRKGMYIIHIFKFAQVLKTGVYIYIKIYIYIFSSITQCMHTQAYIFALSSHRLLLMRNSIRTMRKNI